MLGNNSVICSQNIMAIVGSTKEKEKTRFHFIDFTRSISAIVHPNSWLIPWGSEILPIANAITPRSSYEDIPNLTLYTEVYTEVTSKIDALYQPIAFLSFDSHINFVYKDLTHYEAPCPSPADHP